MTETTLEWMEFNEHLQDLCHDLLENQRLYADCVLKTEGKEIYCHRSILAASSDYLKHIFDAFPYETIMPEILIPEVSYSCLQALVYFMYNGELLSHCKDLNDLWDAATLLDVKSMKSILDGLFTQTQITFDDTLDALVQDLHETGNVSEGLVDKTEPTEVVEDLDLIDALIPIVPVVTTTPNVERKKQVQESVPAQETSKTPKKPHELPSKSASNTKPGTIQKRPMQSLAGLREKALAFQKELEAAIHECKKGATLEEVCRFYPNITKEILYRNIKNFKLAHIKPPE